jgi:hypothetical protein
MFYKIVPILSIMTLQVSQLLIIVIDIDYYMAFVLSYTLSALGHDISPRADGLKGWYMNEGMTCYDLFIIYFNRGNNWFVPKCLVIFGKN